MKILDRYIIKKFLGTFFLSILLIILIVVVFDVSEKIEDFIQKQAPFKAIVVDYYLNFIPYFVNLFSPLFTFIAVIFFTSRMASRTEIVAILSSGDSYKRFLLPYLLSAAVIASLSLTLNNFIIPHSNKKRIDFENLYIKDPFRNRDKNIHIQISPNNYIYLDHYNTDENIGNRFSIERFENGTLTYKLVCDYIKWDSVKQSWSINNYYVRRINSDDESITIGNQLDSTLGFTPKEFGRKDQNLVETMDYFALNKYIQSEKMKGADNIEFLEIEKHRRNSVPFATFIFTLIGASIASRKTRGGTGMHIALGFIIGFAFVLFMQVSTTFAAGGYVTPLLSVWIPNILFGIVALFLLRVAQK